MQVRGLRLSDLFTCKCCLTKLKEGTFGKLATCSGQFRCLEVDLFDAGLLKKLITT